MKFIRDIISEKRGAKPDSVPFPQADHPDDLPAPDVTLSHPLAATSAEPAFDGSHSTEDQLFDNVLNAWVNADVPDTAASAAVRAVETISLPPLERAAAPGTLYLDSTALRSVKHLSVTDKLRHFESVRADAVSVETPRQPSEEKRLRLAMTAYDAPATEPAAPLLSVVAAEPSFSAPAEPNTRSLDEMPFVSVQPPRPDEILTDAGLQVPPPAAGRGSNRSGRVKTRLLGFSPENLGLANPFEKEASRVNDAFPVAWLVVVAGPGRGASFALHDGVSRLGRGEDQTVCLNFGDNSISRENHISIAYDSEQNGFFIGQSGKSNIVRLNNKPLLSTEQVRSGDQIRVGETTLRLVALCGDGFSWTENA